MITNEKIYTIRDFTETLDNINATKDAVAAAVNQMALAIPTVSANQVSGILSGTAPISTATQSAQSLIIDEPPEKYPMVLDRSDEFLHCVHGVSGSEYAYCVGYTGGIFHIFINNEFIKDASKYAYYLITHEFGHIIFGHYSITKETKEAIENKWVANKDKIIDLVKQHNNWGSKTPTPQEEQQSAENFFENMKKGLVNILADLEVQGNMFTEEEEGKEEAFQLANQLPATFYMKTFDEWERGLTLFDYFVLVFDNLEYFIEKLLSQQNNGQGNPNNPCNGGQGGSGNGQGGDGDGSGSGGSAADSIGQGASNSNKLSDVSSAKHGKNNQTDKSKNDIDNDEQNTVDDHDQSDGRGDAHYVEKTEIEKGTTEKKLYSFIASKCSKKTREINRLPLYNYNRGKLGCDVIIPRIFESKSRTVHDGLVILLDVSGSVETKLCKMLFRTFSKFGNSFKDITLITWDTELCETFKGITSIKNARHYKTGGGTDMAAGIKYLVDNKILKKDSTFFLVSDFVDDISEWQYQMEKSPSKKNYGIKWQYGKEAPKIDDCEKVPFKDTFGFAFEN